jgi:putative transposase
VERYGQEYGVNVSLKALGLSKGTWHYRGRIQQAYTEKHAALRAPLQETAVKHPEYGYRKVTTELKESGWQVNHKVVQRLQKAWELPLVRATRPPPQSAIRRALAEMGDRINLMVGLETIGIFEVLFTDFTELLYARGRKKAHLMPILDHTSKLVVGWALGPSANTALALEAYRHARATLLRYRVTLPGIVVHHDQDAVYTSHAWIGEVRMRDRLRLSYSLDGARGNTHMESFNSHFKEENRSVFWEQDRLASLRGVVQRRIDYYNDIRRHASLDNLSPQAFLKKHGLEPRPGASPN